MRFCTGFFTCSLAHVTQYIFCNFGSWENCPSSNLLDRGTKFLVFLLKSRFSVLRSYSQFQRMAMDTFNLLSHFDNRHVWHPTEVFIAILKPTYNSCCNILQHSCSSSNFLMYSLWGFKRIRCTPFLENYLYPSIVLRLHCLSRSFRLPLHQIPLISIFHLFHARKTVIVPSRTPPGTQDFMVVII